MRTSNILVMDSVRYTNLISVNLVMYDFLFPLSGTKWGFLNSGGWKIEKKDGLRI